MDHPEERIIRFIGEHHILTLATSRNNQPWCATCYYVWQHDRNRFIITSDHDTRHIRDIEEGGNPNVSGAIALETKIVGRIRGLQFSGIMEALEGHELAGAKSDYLRRFPVARLMPVLHLWSLTPVFIKMTDNRLGFGKKIIWKSEDSL